MYEVFLILTIKKQKLYFLPDDNLQNNLDKEDDLRSIFTKARKKASEELNELLAEFRNKRTLGKIPVFRFVCYILPMNQQRI